MTRSGIEVGPRAGAQTAVADAATAAARGTDAGLRTLERRENFPVALRVLPRRWQRDLRAVYNVARTIDDAGDEAVTDRGALLDLLDADLRNLAAGRPALVEVVHRLGPTLRAHDLSVQPFLDLVEANRRDQVVAAYPTWDDLVGYCALSADPVGRIVLGIADAATPDAVALSDRICTALQVLEHCQDVAEDLARGRVYLPQADLTEAGVTAAHLEAPSASPALRQAVARQVDRAADGLAAGPALVGELHGAARVAVAGFVAGGLAVVDAMRAADHDVLAVAVRPRRRDVARHALALLAGRR
jgi:squalene synthase HpnC